MSHSFRYSWYFSAFPESNFSANQRASSKHQTDRRLTYKTLQLEHVTLKPPCGIEIDNFRLSKMILPS